MRRRKGNLVLSSINTAEQPKATPCETLNQVRQVEEDIQSRITDPDSHDKVSRVFSSLLELQTPPYRGHSNLKLMLDQSRNNDIVHAVSEWSIVDFHDVTKAGSRGECICSAELEGKTYTLDNKLNNRRLILDSRCTEQLGRYFHRFGDSSISWGFNPIQRKLRKASYQHSLEELLIVGPAAMGKKTREQILQLVSDRGLTSLASDAFAVWGSYSTLARMEPAITDKKSSRYIFRLGGREGMLEWVLNKSNLPKTMKTIAAKAKDGVVPLTDAELGLLFIYVMGRRRFSSDRIIRSVEKDVRTLDKRRNARSSRGTSIPIIGSTTTVTESAALLHKYGSILKMRMDNNMDTLDLYNKEIEELHEKVAPIFVDADGEWHDQNKKETTIYSKTLDRLEHALVKKFVRRATLGSIHDDDPCMSLSMGYAVSDFQKVSSALVVIARKMAHLERVVMSDSRAKSTLKTPYSLDPRALDKIDESKLLKGKGYIPIEEFATQYPLSDEPLEVLLDSIGSTGATARSERMFIRFVDTTLRGMQIVAGAGLYTVSHADYLKRIFHNYSGASWSEDGGLGHAISNIRAISCDIPGFEFGSAIPDLDKQLMTSRASQELKKLSRSLGRFNDRLCKKYPDGLDKVYRRIERMRNAVLIKNREEGGLALSLSCPFKSTARVEHGELFSHPSYSDLFAKYDLLMSVEPFDVNSLDNLRQIAVSDYMSEEWKSNECTLNFEGLQEIYAEVRPLMDRATPHVWMTPDVKSALNEYYLILRSIRF